MPSLHFVASASPAAPRAADAFAEQLRQYRRAVGLTQEGLAERAGLSVRGISDLERGLKAPQRATVDLLIRALALSPEEGRAFDRAAERGRLRRGVGAAGAAPRPPELPRHNLPMQMTSFIGRERELAAVKELLGRTRLLTLAGTGGCGKTRLALQVADAVLDRYPDGVWFVELAPLADLALVPPVVAQAVAVREQPGQPLLATLVAALRSKRLLLVLDNCEHLLEACASLADAFLRGCSHLTILATSREALGMAGETSFRVPSLTLPAADGTTTPRELARSEAVQLFCERAAAARPDFVLTDHNAAAVVQLCRRLDGIPLALELAAARTRALGVRQLAEHLDDRFCLLTEGNRAALHRQQTLRATMDWSYDLLDEQERRLFARLSVFVGGWTQGAAEAVCSGGGIKRQEVLALLARLVEQSLVQAEEQPDGSTRYRLLETVRQYAQEKLDETGESAAIQAAHAAYFVAWVGGPAPPAPALPGEQADAGLASASMAGEVDNLRTALRSLLERGQAELGLGLAARIYHCWFQRGPREEGRAWLCQFLALPAAVTARERLAALFAAGYLALYQGALAEANAALQETVMLAQARGDKRSQALAQTHLGGVSYQRGELARARAELEEGIRLARAADAPRVLLDGLARLADQALAEGDLDGARAALDEARAHLARFPTMEFRFHWRAGDLALAEGDGERAAREYRAALADRSANGDVFGVASSALRLAKVALAAGDGAGAARLLGGFEGIALGVGLRPNAQRLDLRIHHARVEAAARALLGEGAFATLRAEGRRLGVDGVVRLALCE